MKQRFIEWMRGQRRRNGSMYQDSTIKRYAKALEKYVDQIDGLNLPDANLFSYTTYESYKNVDQQIRNNPNFDAVNRLGGNGNGDLSAGMKQYMKFLREAEHSQQDEQMSFVKNTPSAVDNTAEPKETLELIKRYIANKGYSYNDNLVENFYLSLKTKPFVILAGTSGTGKTKLVKLFADSIGAKYKLVSVRPDWSDSSDLFGHTNLQGKFVPGAIIEYVKEACQNLNQPFFLCLDEMNLARVEYYLSDFLSLIETRKWNDSKILTEQIVLDKESRPDYAGLYVPENLYFVGTVNMDETTFPFSKKVLDRANTIEFSDVDLIPDFEEYEITDSRTLSIGNSFLKTKYITLKTDISKQQRETVLRICTELQAINNILKSANAHVGYRVRDEIVFYILNSEEYDILSFAEALDNEIMQKILPRIQGSNSSIKTLLCNLFKKFAGDYSSFSQDQIWKQMDAYVALGNCKYKKSSKKICYMMRRFEEDGFTSYWL